MCTSINKTNFISCFLFILYSKSNYSEFNHRARKCTAHAYKSAALKKAHDYLC